jgi:hypothetical protein
MRRGKRTVNVQGKARTIHTVELRFLGTPERAYAIQRTAAHPIAALVAPAEIEPPHDEGDDLPPVPEEEGEQQDQSAEAAPAKPGAQRLFTLDPGRRLQPVSPKAPAHGPCPEEADRTAGASAMPRGRCWMCGAENVEVRGEPPTCLDCGPDLAHASHQGDERDQT